MIYLLQCDLMRRDNLNNVDSVTFAAKGPIRTEARDRYLKLENQPGTGSAKTTICTGCEEKFGDAMMPPTTSLFHQKRLSML